MATAPTYAIEPAITHTSFEVGFVTEALKPTGEVHFTGIPLHWHRDEQETGIVPSIYTPSQIPPWKG